MKKIPLLVVIERSLTSMKTAVLLILTFALAMIAGTFLESYFGASFANRFLYKNPLFFFLQFCLLTSIFLVTLQRFPYKKRLTGFYLLHSGLLIIGSGSFITWVAGIDGSITLTPKKANRNVILNRDIIRITYPNKSKVVTRQLPFNALPTTLNLQYDDIKIIKYLPFAEFKTKWTNSFDNDRTHSSEYLLQNEHISERFTLSLHSKSIHFNSSLNLGPLNIHYLPEKLHECFSSQVFLWDANNLTCFSSGEYSIDLKKTKTGHRYFSFKGLSYFPDISPYPLDKNLTPILNTTFKVFSLFPFEEAPHLFLFGKFLAFYDRSKMTWSLRKFTSSSKIKLPWMNFSIQLIKHERSSFPQKIPNYRTPIEVDGNLVEGDLKALLLEIRGLQYWVTNEKPLTLEIDGEKIQVAITRENFRLPFELILDRFKMNTNPGTKTPASYESFLYIFSSLGTRKAHVFMNNPLKFQELTFYQASYQQDPQTKQYRSTLSVNIDPGRSFKYIGSLLFVLGSLLHFGFFNRRKVESQT